MIGRASLRISIYRVSTRIGCSKLVSPCSWVTPLHSWTGNMARGRVDVFWMSCLNRVLDRMGWLSIVLHDCYLVGGLSIDHEILFSQEYKKYKTTSQLVKYDRD